MALKKFNLTDEWGEPEVGRSLVWPRSKTEAARVNLLLSQWSLLSHTTMKARRGPEPSAANELLIGCAKADSKNPLSPAYIAWAGDNMTMEARFEEAIEIYREASELLAGHPLKGTSLHSYVYEQRASCFERLGKPEEAIAIYEDLIKRFPKNSEKPVWQFRVGQIAEVAGNDKLAIAAYNRTAAMKVSPVHVEGSIGDLAQRSATHLAAPGALFPHVRDLAASLSSALRTKDSNVLNRLASRTHLAIGGACSELQFVDRERVLSAIGADLETSSVHVDPTALRGSGDKLYMYTTGWKGELCGGAVFFVLTRRRAGWEWSGVALSQLGPGYAKLAPTPKREENQSLQIRIKAPWPAGQCFRAGGIAQFGIIASQGPLAWWISSLADDCGFGVWGFYYNMVGHSGQDAFAIDFTRNVRGFPWIETAGGTPVLSVFDGIVSMSRGTFVSGDATLDNRVEVDHQHPLEVLVALLLGRPIPQPRYRSKYLHLAGPGLLNVSPMMMVSQGSRLGLMDDTGNSAVNHLHFSIHDRNLGFMSVRPTPMDSQTLNDWESGKCIRSTNIEV